MQSSHPRRALVALLALLAAVTFYACSDSTSPAGPAALRAVAAGELVVGAGATASVAVMVTDASGRALSGIAVDWSVATAGGSVSPQQSRTDASGEARTSWTVGTTAGSYELTARVAGLPPVTLTATVRAGAPASIAEYGDPPTSGVVATTVEPAPSVLVTDAQGTPIPDVPVTFAVAGGFGAVSGAEQITNAEGVATVGSWKLGTVTVPNTLTATAGTLKPVTFRVVATAGAPAILRLRTGTD
jgi:adhesin/invasin